MINKMCPEHNELNFVYVSLKRVSSIKAFRKLYHIVQLKKWGIGAGLNMKKRKVFFSTEQLSFRIYNNVS